MLKKKKKKRFVRSRKQKLWINETDYAKTLIIFLDEGILFKKHLFLNKMYLFLLFYRLT